MVADLIFCIPFTWRLLSRPQQYTCLHRLSGHSGHGEFPHQSLAGQHTHRLFVTVLFRHHFLSVYPIPRLPPSAPFPFS